MIQCMGVKVLNVLISLHDVPNPFPLYSFVDQLELNLLPTDFLQKQNTLSHELNS